MRYIGVFAAASIFALAANLAPASADECSGHSHDTGTVAGGAGGALIGGLASHSVVGALAGGVVGALAGNAIARSEDCDHQARADMHDRRDAYENGRADQAEQDQAARDQARQDDADRVAAAQRHDAYEAGRDDQATRDADHGDYPR